MFNVRTNLGACRTHEGGGQAQTTSLHTSWRGGTYKKKTHSSATSFPFASFVVSVPSRVNMQFACERRINARRPTVIAFHPSAMVLLLVFHSLADFGCPWSFLHTLDSEDQLGQPNGGRGWEGSGWGWGEGGGVFSSFGRVYMKTVFKFD